jgi:quinoprotein glucose dehydrogenase
MAGRTALTAALAVAASGLGAQSTSPRAAAASPDAEWASYGHDPGGSRYSPLAQITRDNVHTLQVAWTYHTGDVSDGTDGRTSTQFEATPIMVDGTLYLSTPFNRVIALDPATGQERWSYDPQVDLSVRYGQRLVSRGVSTWLDSALEAGQPCRRRIFAGTNDARLIALDAATGRPCVDFGVRGEVRLDQGIGRVRQGDYQITSPPTIAGDLVIVGAGLRDNQRANAPSGVVRALDARTGHVRWRWEPIPADPADPAWTTWGRPDRAHTGAANAWTTFALDAERDLVFIPTGSASPDYFGGERLGANLYANSLVALRASTGERVWSFQTVHHDLWDYDLPSQPTLLTVPVDARPVPAIAIAGKTGHLFLLHRETGAPLHAVEEKPVPQDTVPEEQAWPTQPVPSRPRPLVPQMLTADQAFGLVASDVAFCRQRIAALESRGIFTPPSRRGTLVFPGNVGGMAWGGAALEPERGLLVVNTNRIATVITLVPRDQLAAEKAANPGVQFEDQLGTRYGVRIEYLISPNRVPCNPPPWGTLTAVDVATGDVRWEVPLGALAGLTHLPFATLLGSINLGGPAVTAGGVVFIGAAMDDALRAFDVATGRELWKGALPAGGQATPMTYRAANGRQYVVIAAGGHSRLGTRLGDALVAFALP